MIVNTHNIVVMADADKDEPDRTEYLHVKMSSDEKKTLKVNAAIKGLSMSEYVREMLCDEQRETAAA